jgi:hypothetical protein
MAETVRTTNQVKTQAVETIRMKKIGMSRRRENDIYLFIINQILDLIIKDRIKTTSAEVLWHEIFY